MDIRIALESDLETIMQIYEYARQFMVRTGNPTQWGSGYPKAELLREDISKKQCYVCIDNEIIHAVFVLMIGNEPTYAVIEDGSWKNDAPYGTIHRLAGGGKTTGVTKICLDFCKKTIKNLRADTHCDNNIMQYLLEKNGFEKCGSIFVEDGSHRIAYQFVG